MPNNRETIQNFFSYISQGGYNAPELLARYTPAMEVQVNVAKGYGHQVEGKSNTFSDGLNEWWHIRIPKDAKTEPHYEDRPMNWSLTEYAEGIGMTGWDWENKVSRWVGFDFDSIVGHAAGVGVSDEELDQIRERACTIPWVEVRKSTGGGGLHLYIHLDAIPTKNHTEHSALGKTVLDQLSTLAGFDFSAAVDVYGGNMWVWHRKVTQENQGLLLLREAEYALEEGALPVYWRDNLEVITRRRSKVTIRGVNPEDQGYVEGLSNSKIVVSLTPAHQRVIEYLCESGFTTHWVHDHNLLQTHTVALKGLLDNHREELDLKGFFETVSTGEDPGKPNAFMFPLDDGAWKVFRFEDSREHPTWSCPGDGYGFCYFNKDPDLATASLSAGGLEDEAENSYMFPTVQEARVAVEALGATIDLGEEWNDRQVNLKTSKTGKLVIRIEKKTPETGPRGWVDKRGWWVQVKNVKVSSQHGAGPLEDYDSMIRCVSSPSNKEYDWVLRDRIVDDKWVSRSTSSIMRWLNYKGHADIEAKQILGHSVENSWEETHMPFQPEYPGNRRWNRGAPQLRIIPSELVDREPEIKTWWKVLNHLGVDLDEAIKAHPWGIENGVSTGGLYLAMWIACMIRYPFDRLPYLFFWGDENCGKSIFHEAIESCLLTAGVARAERALTVSSGFNGELANAVLAVIEEDDVHGISGSVAINRMKSWVTNKTIAIRKMRTDTYSQANSLHMVQMSNFEDSCLARQGDTRITSVFVQPLAPGTEIPKDAANGLLERLHNEAPDFLAFLLSLDLPETDNRFRLPMISTNKKEQFQELMKSPLERFIDESLQSAVGNSVMFSEFFSRFQDWLPTEDRREWSSRLKVSRKVSTMLLQGKYGASNNKQIANVFWANEDVEVLPELVDRNGRLVKVERVQDE